MNTPNTPSTNWLRENFDLLFLGAFLIVIALGVILQNDVFPALAIALAALGYLVVILPRGRNFKDDERVTYIKALSSQVTIGITLLIIVVFNMLSRFELLQISTQDAMFYLMGTIEIVYIGVFAVARRRM